jgi:hypothetical protein
MQNVRPALATSYTYINPAIARDIGVLLAGESVSKTRISSGGRHPLRRRVIVFSSQVKGHLHRRRNLEDPSRLLSFHGNPVFDAAIP